MPLTRPLFSVLSLFTLLSVSLAQQPAPPAATSLIAAQRLQSSYALLPLGFEPNHGQTDARVQFLARTPEASVFLTGADAVLQTSNFSKDNRGQAKLDGLFSVRMHLAGAASNPFAATEQPLSGTINYLRGNDSTQWQREVPTFGGVRLASVYPGVDLRYYGHAGQLEYDFIVAPRADPAIVKLQFQGATAQIESNGDLLLPIAHGKDLRFDKPIAYQIIAGKRIQVEASFAVSANRDVTFQLGAYDHSHELVIDPTLIYLGTLGAGVAGAENVGQIVVDSTGALYFIGTTFDASYPTTVGAYQTVCGPANATAAANNVTYCTGNYTSAYVTKLSADGTRLVYSTYLSGHGGYETGGSIAVDSTGVAYLLGETASNDFPVTVDAFQKVCGPGQPPGFEPAPVPPTAQCNNFHNGGGTEYTINGPEAFYAKLNAAGSSLIYASYLGGTLPVYSESTALDASGNWYVYVQTSARVSSDLYGTGGGNVQYPGITSGGYQATVPINVDNSSALSKFSNDGRTLLYGTFFGNITANVAVLPETMTIGANGLAFLAGYSNAVGLPTTTGAIKQSCTSPNQDGTCQSSDGFIAAIDTTKSGTASLVYSTRIGGSGTQGSNIPLTVVLGLTADSSNDVYATGYTFDHTLPVGTIGYQSTCPNYSATQSTYDYCDSAFVIKVNPTGTAILGGSFLGGPTFRSAESVGYNVRLDSKSQVYVYGRSNDGGGDFPQVNPLQSYKGGNQLFISTFTPDMSKLIFSTRFGNPSYTDHSVSVAGGMVLDSNDNVYFAGTTADGTFTGTTGTYNTASPAGTNNHTFFAKLSKVLQPTTTTVTLSTTTVTTGNTFTLKASVAGILQATPIATGTVTFTYTSTNPATVLGTATLDATGTATFMATAPVAGSYTVVASYGGDSTYDVSASAATALTVKSIVTPVITLTPSATVGKIDTRFSFTANVSSTLGTPTGTMFFMDGTTTLGSAVLSGGAATYSNTLTIGTHSITARYSGDSNFAAVSSIAQSISVTLYTPSVTLGSSTASNVFGVPVTLSASVTISGTTLVPSGIVTFTDGTTILGTGIITNGMAAYTTSALSLGSHSLTASYGGDSNFSASTSSVFSLTVVASGVTLTASPTSLIVTRGSSGTITITATPTGPLTGNVSFACGALPQHSSCLFNPMTLAFNASSASQSTTLSFATNSAALDLPARPFSRRDGLPGEIAAGLFLPLGLIELARRRSALRYVSRFRLLLLTLAASAGILGLGGCGNSSNLANAAAGSYTVPVTASVNGGTSSLSLTITVQ